MTGEFHIWPKGMSMLDEHYMAEDLTRPVPSEDLVPSKSDEFEEEFAIG